MPTSLTSAFDQFLKSSQPSCGTKAEYQTTQLKWIEWGLGVPIEDLNRKHIRDFLTWVYERASENGTNPGRTANKAREQLKAVLAWAWDQEIVESLPRFPKRREQRDVAGRHYLTKQEINALYFATYQMPRPRGWNHPIPADAYWRAALVLFFNYGLDTGTVWGTKPKHEPILWRHVSWKRQSPDSQANEQSQYGWLFYRRVKTGKTFYRPIESGGSHSPKEDHERRCRAGTHLSFLEEVHALIFDSRISAISPTSGRRKISRRVRKSHGCSKTLEKPVPPTTISIVPESSIEILGHSVGGITYRHYAHRTPLAFKAITTLPQPSAFMALVRGLDNQCPCCRRPFNTSRQAM